MGPFMGPDQLREHLRSYGQREIGTDELDELTRRLAVIAEWRQEVR